MNNLKNNFLIIGFTGPLRSGCTTAANFFSTLLHRAVDQYLKSPDEESINRLYTEISFMTKSNANENPIIEKRKLLIEFLRNREIKKALKEETIPAFYSISMSEMLLKYCLEYIATNDKLKGDQKYREIIDQLRSVKFEKDTIFKINNKISEKKYRSINKEECDVYDSYLSSLKNLMVHLKKDNDREFIGGVLQDFGDNIRCHGNPFTSEGILKQSNVSLIAAEANKIIKFMRNRQDKDDNRRHHFVIECFRNPYEVEYFRYRYYEFYLFSIFADKVSRQRREPFSDSRDKRDSGENKKLEDIHKQDVSRCVYLSDIAINNNSTPDDFYEKLMKYYALILRPGCVNATSTESFMDQAYSLSLRSSCISRQVGAVIIGKDGYVVGAGWNDAGEGQIGCGYRQIGDIKNLPNSVLVTNPEKEDSFRRYLASQRYPEDSFCFKDEYSYYVLRKKLKDFMKERSREFRQMGTRKLQQQMIEEWLVRDIKIKRLEYCRALHAEENALLQNAKIGGVGVRGGKIYTTSFPCELCAKKIYQSGIREVIYTEPYPESISQDVFLQDGIKKITLIQFEGVKSHSYYRLYKASADKKERQKLTRLDEVNDPQQEPSP